MTYINNKDLALYKIIDILNKKIKIIIALCYNKNLLNKKWKKGYKNFYLENHNA